MLKFCMWWSSDPDPDFSLVPLRGIWFPQGVITDYQILQTAAQFDIKIRVLAKSLINLVPAFKIIDTALTMQFQP
jgi:hypothetical protein